MEKLIFNLSVTIILLTGTIFFSGCNSSAQKEDAQSATEEIKNDVDEAQDADNGMNDWETFKTDAYAKIEKNNARIAELKEKMNKPGMKNMDKMRQNRIDELEQKNSELKAKIDNYNKDDSNWESFKTEFNHDMDELGKALEDLTDDNVK